MNKQQETTNVMIQEMNLLREREKKYHQWFEDAPISLWEQDYSEVKQRVDEIKGRNAGDLEAYFRSRPDLVRELAGLVRVVDVNSFTLQMYKATSKEVFLSGITKVFSMESYEDFIPALIAVAEGRKRLFLEKTHVALDGEVLSVQLHWAVAPGFEDTYGRILVSIVDITGLKRTERLLERRSSERRLLLDTLPVQVWYLTDPDTYGTVNRAHADFFGRHPRGLAYKRLEEFTPPDVARACRQSNIEAFRTKQPVHTEEWVPNAAGDRRLIAVTKTPRLDEDGHVQWVVCTGVDITDQRRAEMRVRDSEARFRYIFELSPAGIELYDGDGRLVLANPACLEIFGIQDAGEIRRFDLFDDPNLDEALKEKLRRGEMVQYDVAFDFEKVREAHLYHTTKQGIIHLQVIINPMPLNGAENPAWYLVLVSDVTDRTLKEQQLRETQERLREAQHLAHMGVWNWDSATDTVTWTHE
ncbi:MAG TPA: PAS domain S-box protein, partial [Desulfobacteraceae bacterium]|nr:PAS domain S-box protein [Desulfobacteraceae bacterium]